MEQLWILSIKTSLPKTCERQDKLKTAVYAFDSFEKARDAMRTRIKEYAFSKNAMFDGEGKITELSHYIGFAEDFPMDDSELGKTHLLSIQESLTRAFSGEDTTLSIKSGFYTDYMISINVKSDSIRFDGDDDGPCNGYDPVLATNIFSMEKEKDYYLYIDDRFGQMDSTAELYMDLKKCKLNEMKSVETEAEETEEAESPQEEEKTLQKNSNPSFVKFGLYEWQVLIDNGTEKLLISKEPVAELSYHHKNKEVTWENCRLRSWLNNEFLSEFSEADRARIKKVIVHNPDNALYGTPGGDDTADSVFLLSIDEAENLMDDNDRWVPQCGSWWLRSPGRVKNQAACVWGNGGCDWEGNKVHYMAKIRPAMWVES